MLVPCLQDPAMWWPNKASRTDVRPSPFLPIKTTSGPSHVTFIDCAARIAAEYCAKVSLEVSSKAALISFASAENLSSSGESSSASHSRIKI